MPYYLLVASGRPDVIADEIILSRDEATGEVNKSIRTRVPVELSEEELVKANEAAARVGYRVVETVEPSDENKEVASRIEAGLPVGADVVGQSPIVEETGVSGAQIDQQAQAQQADEANSDSENHDYNNEEVS